MPHESLILLPFTFVALLPFASARNEVTIGPRFHTETSFGARGFKAERVDWGKPVPLYKEYAGAERTKLTPRKSDGKSEGKSVELAISQRRSHREFTKEALSLVELSQALLSADGITEGGPWPLRAAPSAGALYPVDMYVAALNVESLDPGLYHFRVLDSSLELVKRGEFADSLVLAANTQRLVGAAPAVVILSARFDRVTQKYADRGYRYAYIECGAICENIYLQAESLDLGTCAVGAFNDDALNGLLGVDGEREAALLMMPLGHPAD